MTLHELRQVNDLKYDEKLIVGWLLEQKAPATTPVIRNVPIGHTTGIGIDLPNADSVLHDGEKWIVLKIHDKVAFLATLTVNLREYHIWGIPPNGTEVALLLDKFDGCHIFSKVESENLASILETKYKCTNIEVRSFTWSHNPWPYK